MNTIIRLEQLVLFLVAKLKFSITQTKKFTIIKVSHKVNTSAQQNQVKGFALSDPPVKDFPFYCMCHHSVQTEIFLLTMLFTCRNIPLVMFSKGLNRPIQN